MIRKYWIGVLFTIAVVFLIVVHFNHINESHRLVTPLRVGRRGSSGQASNHRYGEPILTIETERGQETTRLWSDISRTSAPLPLSHQGEPPFLLEGNTSLVHHHECRLCLQTKISYAITPDNLCVGQVDMVFVINSGITNFERRNAMRMGWLRKSSLPANVRFVFAVGLGSASVPTSTVTIEAEEHNDILQGRFEDTYRNLTLKTTMAFAWLKSNCQGAKWVFKTDDDVYINLDALYSRMPTTASVPIMYGRCYLHKSPIIRDPLHRWYLSEDVYPNRTYPIYCCGCGYVTTAHVVFDLVDIMHRTPLIPFEDAFVGICATSLKYKVKLESMGSRFIFRSQSENKTRTCGRIDHVIAIHDVTTDDMSFYDSCHG